MFSFNRRGRKSIRSRGTPRKSRASNKLSWAALRIEALESRRLLTTTLTWTGADAPTNPNWSDPNNWSISGGSDTTPKAGDAVVFNNTAAQNSVIDQAFTIGSFSESGYAGQVSLGAESLAVSSGFSIADAASFAAGTGTVDFTGGQTVNSAAALYNVIANANGTLTDTQALVVSNSLTVSSALNIDTSPIDVAGNVTVNAGVGGNSNVTLDGASNQTLSGNTSGYLTNLNVAQGSGANVLLPANFSLFNTGSLTGSGHIENTGGALALGLAGNYGPTTFTANFAGTVDDLILQLFGATVNDTLPLVVNNTLTVPQAASINSHPIDVAGNVTVNAGVGGNSNISLDGASDQTLTGNASGYLTNLNVAQGSGASVLLPSNFMLFNGGTLTGAGHFKNTGGALALGLAGNYGPTTFTANFAGTVDDLILQVYGATVNDTQPLVVNNTLTVPQAANINSNPIEVAGNVTVNAGVGGNSYVNLDGPGDQTLTGNGYLTNLNVANGGNVLLPANFMLFNGGTLTGTGHFKNMGGALAIGLAGNYGPTTFTANFAGTVDDLILQVYGATVNDTQPLVVNNTLTVPQAASINSHPIDVAGNVTANAGVGGNSYVNLDGPGDQTLTGSGYLTNLNVANGGNVLLPSNFMLFNSGTLTGTGHFKNTGGALALGLGGNEGFTTFTANFAGTVDDLILQLYGATVNDTQPLVVNDTLTVAQAANINSHPIDVAGNVTANAGVGGNSYVNLDGPGDQTLTGSGYLTNLNVANGGNVLLPSNFMLFNSGTLTGTGHFKNTGGALALGLAGNYGPTTFTANFAGTVDDLILQVYGATVNDTQPLVVNDTLTVPQAANINNNPIDVAGNVTANAGVGGNSNITLDGTSDQTLTGSGYLTNLNVAQGAGASVLLPSTFMLFNSGTLTGAGHFKNTGGALALGLGGNEGFTTFTANFAGTVDDLILQLYGANVNDTQPLIVNNTLTVSQAASVNSHPIDVAGNVTANAGVGGNSNITLDGASDQTLTGNASGYLTNLNVAQGTGASVLLPSNFMLFNSGTLTGAGHFKNTGGALALGLGGNEGFTTFTANFAGTVDDLILQLFGANVNDTQPLVVNNTLTASQAASVNSHPIDVAGNVTVNAGVAGNSAVALDGSTDQSLTGTGSLTNLIIAKPGGHVLMSTFDRNFSTVTVAAGQWDVLGNAVAASSGFLAQGGNITGTGTLSGGTTTSPTTGIVTVNAGGTLSGTLSIKANVTANNGGTISPGSAETINGNLALTSGSTYFEALNDGSSNQLTLNGGLTIGAGSPGVTLSGTTATPLTSTFSIITKNTAESGIFAGDPAGGVVSIGGTKYQIEYNGGAGGHDVTLGPALALSGTSSSVTVTEGQTATNSGTFTDLIAGSSPILTASIGTLTTTGTSSGTWSWSDAAGDESLAQIVTITATDSANGLNATFSFPLTVNDAPLTGSSGATASGGVAGLTVATLTNATFTDAAGSFGSAADFTVQSVNWGDGNTSAAGLTFGGSNGNYSVNGSHLYTATGTDSFTIVVEDDGGSTATITGTANVAPPTPTLSSISPTSATEGGTDFTITANGGNFASASTIDWNGVALATTFVSSIELTATVPAADIAEEGGASVTVVNPGGGTSSVQGLTINDAALTAGALTPPAGIGSPTVSTFVNGGLSQPSSMAFDASGNLYVANQAANTISKITPSGSVSVFVSSGLNRPSGLVFDSTGNMYVSNVGDNTISKITPSGAVSTFASGGGLNAPEQLAFDSSGNLYAVNFFGNSVSKISPTGVVSTFASGGSLNNPTGIAIDSSGNVYAANYSTGTVSEITPAAVITTFASGLSNPGFLIFNPAGNLLVNGSGDNQIDEISASGAVSTLVSTGSGNPYGIAFDSAGTMFVGNFNSGSIVKVTLPVLMEGQGFTNQTVLHFTDANPNAAASDYTAVVTLGDGNQVTLTSTPSANGQIVANSGGGFDVQLSYTYSDELTNATFSVAVTDIGGASTSASTTTFNVADATLTAGAATVSGGTEGVTPATLTATFTDANTLGSASDFSGTIRWGDGATTPFTSSAVSGSAGYYTVSASHQYAEEGTYSVTVSIADDGGSTTADTGTVTVADASLVAGALTPPAAPTGTPTVTTFASGLGSPDGLVFDANGNLFATNRGNNTVSEVTPSGAVSKFVASGGSFPVGIARDSAGNFYVANQFSNTIQKITPTGQVTAFVTSGLNNPIGIVFDASGNMYVSNLGGAIDKVSATGTVTPFVTVNGAYEPAFDAQGNLYVPNWGGSSDRVFKITPSGSASTFVTGLSGGPVAVAFDASGNLYVSNYLGNTISKVTPAGVASTYVTGLSNPIGLAFDSAGNLYVANAGNNTISKITPPLLTEGQAFTNETVFHFTDADPNGAASDFTAVVTLGDGNQVTLTSTPSANGQIVANSGGGFDVQLSYTYADELTNATFSVAVADIGGASTSASTNTFNVADAALTAGSATVSGGTEGVTPASLTATFSDANTLGSASDFSGTIRWGDGATTPFTSSAVSGSAGNYTVRASHQYAEEGTYSVTVSITDDGGSTTADTGTATVADAPLVDSSSAVAAASTEGASTGSIVLATFTDANPGNNSGDFTATINWAGTGSGSTSGTVTYGSGTYTVTGSYTYADEGTYTPTVSIADDGGSTLTAIGKTTVTVADAPLTDSSSAVAAASTEGASTGSIVLATFTDANPGNNSGDFTATINWAGAGSGGTSGTVSYSSGTYAVTGNYIYADEGTYTPTVSITDDGGSTLTTIGKTTVTVADAPLADSSSIVAAASTEGASTGSIVLATFTDANPGNNSSDFTATINWAGAGSGGTSGTVSYSSGTYAVTGNYIYADEGTYTPTVSITDDGGSTLTAIGKTTVTVADAPLTDSSSTVAAASTEGASTGNIVLATFTDGNPGNNSGDFTATINWAGAGSGGTSGTVTYGSGAYTVSGSYTYADEGSYSPTVSIADDGGSTLTAIGKTTVTVADAPLTDSSSAVAAASTEGASTGNIVLATFTDANPGNNSSDFTATINWAGAGSGGTSGAVTYSGSTYTVTGSYTYADEGTYTPTVSIVDDGGSTLTAIGKTTVTVADAPLTDSSSTVAAASTEGASTGNIVLATFTDANPGNNSSDFTATINWTGAGSGGTSGTVTYGSGAYTVSGSYTYADEGSYSPTVSIADDGGSTLTAIGKTTVTVADAPLTDSSSAVAAASTEGASTGNIVLATFTDANPGNNSSDFTAAINWNGAGSGGTSGTVTYSGSTYTVTGSYTYADEGTYTPTVSIADDGGSSLTAIGRTTVTVADAPLTDSSSAVAAASTEGASTGSIVLATFTDANPGNNSGDFTATINWNGTGSGSTSGAVTYGGGSYTVTGSYTYADEGTFTPTVSIADDGGSTLTAIGKTTVTVADAPLTDSSSVVAAASTEGASTGSIVLATFTDANPGNNSGDFTATINWNGAGSGGTSGTVTYSGSTYTVTGSYTYADEGTFTPTVSITDDGGSTLTAIGKTTVTVADAPLADSSSTVAAASTEGASTGSIVLATFTDANPGNNSSDFTATINWAGAGSGGTSGAVTYGSGTYTVSGSYTYADEGTYTPTVSIADDGGSTLTAIGQTTVKVADAPLADSSSIVAAASTEGASTGSIVLATFTDANPGNNSSDFTATINWNGAGSGGTSGTVSYSGGTYTVSGTYTYADEGTYTPTVSITDDGGSTLTAIGKTTVTVADAPLTDSSNAVAAASTEGASTGSIVLATFTDTNPGNNSSDFTATINWAGAGNGGTSGTVSYSGGTYTVSGTYTYADEGTYTPTVSITDDGGSTLTAIGKTTVTVADAALTAGTASISGGTEGVTPASLTATFTDANTLGGASDFSGTINWGDGATTPFTSGAVSGSAGNYAVSASHQYAEEGTYSVTVSISDDGGSATADTGTATVADAPLTGATAAGATVGITGGLPVTLAGASFTDANLGGTLGDFQIAAANWGDGTSATTGLTISGAAGNFIVSGTHLYAHGGTYNYSISVADDGGQTTTIRGSATVAGPGATPIGNTLYLVGGNTNDQVYIRPVGSSNTGSTGILLYANLAGIDIDHQVYGTTTPITSIVIWGFGGNDNVYVDPRVTTPITVVEGDGDNNIRLGGGNNVITVGGGNDHIQAGNGNNTVTVHNSGDDDDDRGDGRYCGGDDDGDNHDDDNHDDDNWDDDTDTIQLGNGNNVITIGGGNVRIQAGDGNNTITVNNPFQPVAPPDDDDRRGDDDDDDDAGNDTITLGNGNNVITAGNNNLNIFAGNGSNTVTAGNGNDNIWLGLGDGDDDDDDDDDGWQGHVAPAVPGNNNVALGNGNDQVQVGDGNNTITVGSGDDQIQAGNGNNVIVAGGGNDNIEAGNGDNLIVGGLGRDNLRAGNGHNILIDGSVAQATDQLWAVLDNWMADIKAGDAASAIAADLASGLAIQYNLAHANSLHAGKGFDAFFATYAKDRVNAKHGDLLNGHVVS